MEEDWSIVLSVLESPDSSLIGQQKVFTTSPITMGRGDENNFVITDPTVSRNHTTLRITNDYSRVFITDTSTHGTIVGDKAVPKGLGSGFTISDGENIKIGNTLLRFELNLKQSVQSTFVGKIDRDFLDKPPEPRPQPVEKAEVSTPEIPTPVVEKKSSTNFVYIGIIVISILILVYLIFIQK